MRGGKDWTSTLNGKKNKRNFPPSINKYTR